MSNPSPILTIAGRVHAVVTRAVEPAEARPEQRDEQGNFLRAAMPARDGYDVLDVTILTEHGGFATVSFLPAALEAMGGELPQAHSEVSYPVRPFVSWKRTGQRSYSVVGLSVAGDVAAHLAAKSDTGRRSSVVSVPA